MILHRGLPPDRGRPAGQAPMRSTSLPRSVTPIAIGPSIAAVPETSCPQSKQTWRSKILMRSSIVNSTLSGFAAPLTTDCMLWIFLCLVLAHAGLFPVGVLCTNFKPTPTLVPRFPLRPSSPRIPTSTEAQAYWTSSSCALAVPTRTPLTGSDLDLVPTANFDSSSCGSLPPSALCPAQPNPRPCPLPLRVHWCSGRASELHAWGMFREGCLVTAHVFLVLLAHLMYPTPLFVQPAHLKPTGFAGSPEPHVQFQGRITSFVLGTWCRMRCSRCSRLFLL
jgi:hypothetical protein